MFSTVANLFVTDRINIAPRLMSISHAKKTLYAPAPRLILIFSRVSFFYRCFVSAHHFKFTSLNFPITLSSCYQVCLEVLTLYFRHDIQRRQLARARLQSLCSLHTNLILVFICNLCDCTHDRPGGSDIVFFFF